MPGAIYTDGDLVTVSATFLNSLGVPADPATVKLDYRKPFDLIKTTVTYPSAPIVKDSVGNYHANLDTTGQSGNTEAWVYQWYSPDGDTLQAMSKPDQGIFFVRPRAL